MIHAGMCSYKYLLYGKKENHACTHNVYTNGSPDLNVYLRIFYFGLDKFLPDCNGDNRTRIIASEDL